MNHEKITERQIILAMLVSDDYMKQVRECYRPEYMRSDAAGRITRWAVEYYDKYNKVMQEGITEVYVDKIKKEHISEEVVEQIENILESISDEYDRDQFNFEYIADKTEIYFQARAIELNNEKVQVLLDNGDVEEANALIANFSPPKRKIAQDIDLSDPAILERVSQAFAETAHPLFKLPGALGELINEHLLRDCFVALQGSEKRGKTWNLMELALKASKQGCNVALFQAGDMSEKQQLRRIAISRAHLSDKAEYTGWQYVPVKDCLLQQTDQCTRPERESELSLFKQKYKREDITKDMLLEAAAENPEYEPCRNCSKIIGIPWLKKVNLGSPITEDQARQEFQRFFVNNGRRFKLSTHAAQTLTVKDIEHKLDEWEKDNFIADVVVIDYADLLVSSVKEFRHSQNDIWMNLRGLSQKRHLCLITATQADAKAYETNTLTLQNFSEDKRKYAHVTAMFGLNQDKTGREKELGILRYNIILAREGDFNANKCVCVLQSLKQGRAIITSYW